MNLDKLYEIFHDCEFEGDKIVFKSNLHNVIKFITDNYPFDILKEITAVHNSDGRIELIYNLYSTEDKESLLISTYLEGNEAESIADIFDSAKADENEIFDLFGVKFLGNEGLKRLYMPEDWQGHPLRKDYVQDDTRLAWNDDKNNV